MHGQAGDTAGLLQPHQRPCLTRVGGFVDALPDGDVTPNLPLTGARPNDVGVDRRDRERPDRLDRLVVEDLIPMHTAISRLVDTARGRSDVVRRYVSRDSDRGGEAVTLRSDVPPLEARVTCGVRRALSREVCEWQPHKRDGREQGQGSEWRTSACTHDKPLEVGRRQAGLGQRGDGLASGRVGAGTGPRVNSWFTNRGAPPTVSNAGAVALTPGLIRTS